TYDVVRGGLTIAHVPEHTRSDDETAGALIDAKLIVAMHTHLPALLAAAKEREGLRARLAEVESKLAPSVARLRAAIDERETKYEPGTMRAVEYAKEAIVDD